MSKTEDKSAENLKTMLSFVMKPEDVKVCETECKQEKQQAYEDYVQRNSSSAESILSPQPSATHAISRLLKLEDPTVIVKIASFSFKVNMEVLEVYSEYMRERNEMKVFSFPEDEVSPIAFTAIYEWMLCDNPRLPRKGIVELYKAAAYLRVPELLSQFWKCISNPIINEDKAFVMYLEALAFEAPAVRKVMLNRISKFFLPIVASEEFLYLPIEDLCTLLRSNLIGVNSEIEIYFACVRFFNFNWKDRKVNLFQAMSLVRLDFLPTSFVLELLNGEKQIDNYEVIRMMEHPKLMDNLRDLMHFHCVNAFPGPSSVPVRKSCHRLWICDSDCDYHSDENPRSTNPEYFKYVEFSNYLKYLNKAGPKHWESFEILSVDNEKSAKPEVMWEIL